jgi:hypothetical protein
MRVAAGHRSRVTEEQVGRLAERHRGTAAEIEEALARDLIVVQELIRSQECAVQR